MSEPALKAELAPCPAGHGPIVDHQRCTLLGPMMRQCDGEHRLTVLDIGDALPETVDFFSTRTCRLHFVDLFREPFVAEQSNLSESELQQAFREQLRFPSGTRLDVCLLWDFLAYLDDPALRAFNAALRPWLSPATRAYGFGAHHLAIRLGHSRYGIKDAETLTVRERSGRQLGFHPHSQIEMHELLDGFVFERGLLLADGRLEMLLRAQAGGAEE